MNYERIMQCARGWNWPYRDMWRRDKRAAGFTETEIRLSDILGLARNEMRQTHRVIYGDPAYGKQLDGTGGYEAFTNEALDRAILDHAASPLYADAAALLLQIQKNSQPAECGTLMEAA